MRPELGHRWLVCSIRAPQSALYVLVEQASSELEGRTLRALRGPTVLLCRRALRVSLAQMPVSTMLLALLLSIFASAGRVGIVRAG